jgi:WhiB family redox-sensing transcriptional regulator
MTQHHDALRTAGLAARENWRAAAACRFADPDLFFPVSDDGKGLDQVMAAKAICAGCRVRRQCLAFALRTRQVHGIWGGLTERERHAPGPDGTEPDPGAGDRGPRHLRADDRSSLAGLAP